jgi:hypothetical protein
VLVCYRCWCNCSRWLNYYLLQALLQINLHGDYPDSPIQRIINDETALARLRGHLQIDGEIILWSAFWAGISSLMMGKPLDELISIPDLGSGGMMVAAPEGGAAGAEGRIRSDSEIARALQAEIDGELTQAPANVVKTSSSGASALDFSALFSGFGSATAVNTAASASNSRGGPNAPGGAAATGWGASQPQQTQTQSGAKSEAPTATAARPRSDSEVARELQEQFYAEDGFPAYSEDNFSAAAGLATRQTHSLSMDVNPGRPQDTLMDDDLPALLPVEEPYSTPRKRPHAEEGGYVGKMPAIDLTGGPDSSAFARNR